LSEPVQFNYTTEKYHAQKTVYLIAGSVLTVAAGASSAWAAGESRSVINISA
jgi:hypothetical protein